MNIAIHILNVALSFSFIPFHAFFLILKHTSRQEKGNGSTPPDTHTPTYLQNPIIPP